MEKAEIKQISDFLYDEHEGFCEGDEVVTMQFQLTELYRVIKRLMEATFETKDQRLKVLLASPDYKARQGREHIEARLAVKNKNFNNKRHRAIVSTDGGSILL